MSLLTIGNPKTLKGERYGYLTAGLHLAPHTVSGVMNTCPWADGCQGPCLNTAGRGGIPRADRATLDVGGGLTVPDNVIQRARIRRTRDFHADRSGFVARLSDDVRRFERYALARDFVPVVRPNVLSDIPWEHVAPALFADFPGVQWIDYTKGRRRFERFLSGDFPGNYYLALSRSASLTWAEADAYLQRGGTVVVVFDGPPPARWRGRDVTPGDAHDLRFTDTPGTWVGLKAKGRARRDVGGFVVRATSSVGATPGQPWRFAPVTCPWEGHGPGPAWQR